eukprot:9182965-Pyramimonas_sp.AAC.1
MQERPEESTAVAENRRPARRGPRGGAIIKVAIATRHGPTAKRVRCSDLMTPPARHISGHWDRALTRRGSVAIKVASASGSGPTTR